jgi:hypothetical protein
MGNGLPLTSELSSHTNSVSVFGIHGIGQHDSSLHKSNIIYKDWTIVANAWMNTLWFEYELVV